MRAQLSVEYIFAVFAWVLVCTTVAYLANGYFSAFSSSSLELVQTARLLEMSEVAGSDLEGMKFLQGNYLLDGNLSFNNSISSLKTKEGEYLGSSAIRYAYSDEIPKGSKFLIKNIGGEAVVAKVS